MFFYYWKNLFCFLVYFQYPVFHLDYVIVSNFDHVLSTHVQAEHRRTIAIVTFWLQSTCFVIVEAFFIILPPFNFLCHSSIQILFNNMSFSFPNAHFFLPNTTQSLSPHFPCSTPFSFLLNSYV
jgi:hypothetical protein